MNHLVTIEYANGAIESSVFAKRSEALAYVERLGRFYELKRVSAHEYKRLKPRLLAVRYEGETGQNPAIMRERSQFAQFSFVADGERTFEERRVG